MKNYFINLFKKLYSNLHLLVIPICCGIIVIFWTYLLLQQEVRNSLSLVINEINVNTLIISVISVIIYFLFRKFQEFKQELFDKIEREHRNTISYLQSKLTEEINYSTKAILLQEKLKNK
jgi:hypothetical protein